MIDACASMRCFAVNTSDEIKVPIAVYWQESWREFVGRGVTVGLLDTGFEGTLADLVGADIVQRSFVATAIESPELIEHGTYSVSLLMGQGRSLMKGIAPGCRLLIARVIGTNGIAQPGAVAEAIEWLVASQAQIVILPLGDSIEYKEITQQIEQGTRVGTLFFAAAGNGHPDPLVFPARLPGAIAVGACDLFGNLVPECSRQPRLDLVAPGWQIPALIRNDYIHQRSGSSVACVFAAGIATLALSAGAIPKGEVSRARILAKLRRA